MKHLFAGITLILSLFTMSIAYGEAIHVAPLKFKNGYNEYACYCRQDTLFKVILAGKLPAGVQSKAIQLTYPAFILEMRTFPAIKKNVWIDLRNPYTSPGGVTYLPYSASENSSRTGVNKENGVPGRVFAWVKFTLIEDDLIEGQIRYDLQGRGNRMAIYPFRAEVINNQDLPTICF